MINTIMKRSIYYLSSLLLCLLTFSEAQAQTASTYYTKALEVSSTETSTAIVGNVLCYLNRREFPTGSSSDAGDASSYKDNTSLLIGGTYSDDYYTFVLNVAQEGSYTITLAAGTSNSDAQIILSTASVTSTPTQGDTDADITYTEVGTKTIQQQYWTTYYDMSFTATLSAGINYVKIKFYREAGSYVGNVNSFTVAPYEESTEPALTSITIGGSDVLNQFTKASDDTYTYDYAVSASTTSFPTVAAEANSLGTATVSYSSETFAINGTATVVLSNKSTSEKVATYVITFKASGYNSLYEGAVEVGSAETSAAAKNVLCMSSIGEFTSTADATNLAIGSTYGGSYFTLVANASEAGNYDMSVQIGFKSGSGTPGTLYAYQASASTEPANGEIDTDIDYALAGSNTVEATSGWTNYQTLTYTIALSEGYNYIRIYFGTDCSKYGGNIGVVSFSALKSYSVSIPSYGLASFSAKQQVALADGLTAYKAVYMDNTDGDDYVLLTAVEGDIPANTGVILAGTEGESYTLAVSSSETSGDYADNGLVATSSEPTIPSSGYTCYGLNADAEGEAEFAAISAGLSLSGHKAYLKVEETQSQARSSLSFLFASGSATSIENVASKTAATDGAIYSLQGVRVENPTKGLYIQNGKKVIIK